MLLHLLKKEFDLHLLSAGYSQFVLLGYRKDIHVDSVV